MATARYAYRNSVVKVVAFGEAGRLAASRIVQDGFDDIEIVHFDFPTNDEDITEEFCRELSEKLIGTHMTIFIGAVRNTTALTFVRHAGLVSRDRGAVTVGIFVTYSDRVGTKTEEALTASDKFFDGFDTTFVVTSNQLIATQSGVGSDLASLAANFLNLACAGLAEIFTDKQRLTFDFLDVKEIFTLQGQSIIGVGVGRGPDRSTVAMKEALKFIDDKGLDLKTARGWLLILKATREIPLAEYRSASTLLWRDILIDRISDDAIAMNALIEGGNLGEELRVTVIATGITHQILSRC